MAQRSNTHRSSRFAFLYAALDFAYIIRVNAFHVARQSVAVFTPIMSTKLYSTPKNFALHTSYRRATNFFHFPFLLEISSSIAYMLLIYNKFNVQYIFQTADSIQKILEISLTYRNKFCRNSFAVDFLLFSGFFFLC